jgi:glycosyltransferase involved in cell wall biosynthesis
MKSDLVQSPCPLTFISSSSELGGAEAMMLSIIDGLDPGRIQSVVFLGDGPVVDEVRSRGLAAEVAPAARRAGLAGAALRVRRILRGREHQVVHANGVRAAIVAAGATVGTGHRVVWLKVDSSRDGAVARLLARRCDRIVGISHTVHETFPGSLRDRLRVVYPGIPVRPVDRPSARHFVVHSLNCPEDAEVVVLAARLTPSKGQMDIIEALPAIRAKRPRVRLTLLGGETWPWAGYEQRLKARAQELNVADAIAFLGHRPPGVQGIDDVVRFVSGCDLLVAPSREEPKSGWREGFGYSPVEAMSVSVPVVAYRHGSFPEVLGSCARFVTEGDTRALAEAVTEVLANPELAHALRKCGSARAARYRPEKMVDGLKAVYREVAGDWTGESASDKPRTGG